MKIKNIIGVVALPALLMASAIAFAGAKKAEEAKAETDVGTVTVNYVRNDANEHFDSNIYLVLNEVTALPDSWDYAYSAVDESSGVFINGEKQASAVLKHANGNDIHYGLPRLLNEGDVVEFKGTFATNSAGGYSFSIDFGTQRFAGDWVFALEEYDCVSLKDANLPNFEYVTMNTDAIDGSYAYVTDPAGLPKQKGFFGLTHETYSYSLQFNLKQTSAGGGWFRVLIGASGTLYSTGHFLDFRFLSDWAPTGNVEIYEYKGNGNNWAADEIQKKQNVGLNWVVNENNLMEMGAIKVKNSNYHYIFVKSNGVLAWSDYWLLDSTAGAMTTKVTMVYNDTNMSITNSLEPKSTTLNPGTYVVANRQLYLNMAADICPAVNNWDYYFMSVDGNGLKLNGSNIGVSNWNYFKKTGSTQMFLALGDLGITPVEGDILYVGGMFKAAAKDGDFVDSTNPVLYKVNFANSYFEFDGEAWHSVNPNYEAGDFAKDLLKLTAPVCSAAQDGNHDALASLWLTLADGEHYASLVSDEKDILVGATADSTIVVPATEAGIDEMLPEDAVAAAMYRYDYCTAKYSLTNFISGRTVSVSFDTNVLSPMNNHSNGTLIIVITVLSITSLSLAGVLVFKRKHR